MFQFLWFIMFYCRWFWEVFHELSIEDKKKFLLFLTGSDRVPIQGMRDIKVKSFNSTLKKIMKNLIRNIN